MKPCMTWVKGLWRPAAMKQHLVGANGDLPLKASGQVFYTLVVPPIRGWSPAKCLSQDDQDLGWAVGRGTAAVVLTQWGSWLRNGLGLVWCHGTFTPPPEPADLWFRKSWRTFHFLGPSKKQHDVACGWGTGVTGSVCGEVWGGDLGKKISKVLHQLS